MSTCPGVPVKASVTVKLFVEGGGGELGGLVEVEPGDLSEQVVLERSLSTLYQYLNLHLSRKFDENQS